MLTNKLGRSEFFQSLNEEYLPDQIKIIDQDHYSYKWMDGTVCTDPRIAMEVGKKCLWIPTGERKRAWAYADYVESRCADWRVMDVCRFLRMSYFDIVCNPHGDYTLENIVITPGGPKLIDPGWLRGAPFAENDVGKIIQSVVTRWEQFRGRPQSEFTMEFTREQYAFAITHWARLQRHFPSAPFDWAVGLLYDRFVRY